LYLLIAATIFLSAFLLFLVQPIIAKLILPRFGGSAAVWATCLVFFQGALLCGYAYADRLVRSGPRPPMQLAHVALLLVSLALLPITPAGAGDAVPMRSPSSEVLLLLAASVGLPFVLLATTSPLLQAWTAGLAAGRNPYRLFAVSNLASLAALACYPWVIEPWLAADRQALVWSVCYGVYVVLLCAIAWRRLAQMRDAAQDRMSATSAAAAASEAPPGAARAAAWVTLAAIASFELVAVTNHLTQNVPSFPLMWVLPLVIYLVTFVLCFDNDRWYRPRVFALLTMSALAAMVWMLLDNRFAHDLAMQTLVFLPSLFVVCMLCHGELALARPAAAHLSRFYLGVAVGGAVGGALVGIAAPLLLPATFEVEIGLVLVAGALCWRSRGRGVVWGLGAWLFLLGAAVTASYRIHGAGDNVVAMNRNFYGVLRVREYGTLANPASFQRTLAHGGILHGEQYMAPDRRRLPTSYYTETSGVGRVLTSLGARPAQVGLVGLGAGTLAAYGRRGDSYTFFEIDPAIVTAARRHFTYLADTAATLDVLIGDGRLLLQRQPSARFDALVIDAFSGDSIPVHLLTREAVQLYAAKTSADGVIALHVSNRYLDLKPVVARVAAELGLHTAYIDDKEEEGRPDKSSSDWILLSKSRRLLDLPAIRDHASDLPASGPQHLWTDGFSNIVAVIRRDRIFAF
jgi:hypothetical protein